MGILKSVLALSLVSMLYAQEQRGMPEEYFKLSGQKAKEYFFKFFSKRIEHQNKKILEERDFILSIYGRKDLKENSEEYKKLLELQKKYKVQKLYNYKKYIMRIDIIPVSMALAQAATESGWGRSRFIKVANNIFGHWTYNPKHGMVPQRRPDGQKHLIKVFPSLEASIAAYMRNLNRTGAYLEFREQRAKMRALSKFIDGYLLSKTMTKYSGIGHDYVKILQTIIRMNGLRKYDISFCKRYILKTQLTLKEKNEICSTAEI